MREPVFSDNLLEKIFISNPQNFRNFSKAKLPRIRYVHHLGYLDPGSGVIENIESATPSFLVSLLIPISEGDVASGREMVIY